MVWALNSFWENVVCVENTDNQITNKNSVFFMCKFYKDNGLSMR